MTKEEIANKLQSIIVDNFNVSKEQFDWEQPLEVLQEDFTILSYLVQLDQLITIQFEQNISIVENISTGIHTPKDILHLIMNKL